MRDVYLNEEWIFDVSNDAPRHDVWQAVYTFIYESYGVLANGTDAVLWLEDTGAGWEAEWN